VTALGANDEGRVLVVDDSHESLRLLVDILTSHGYEAQAADSGELALASVGANPPDLILLDIRMPELDGFEVCRRLKVRPESAGIPIMFISGAAETSERAAGLSLGAVDFITKPFQADELLARVRTHLELARLRAQLERRAGELEAANEQLRVEMAERDNARARELILERRLQESQKLESLGVLAGGIAHDFNNILTSVLGSADLALRDLPPSALARANLLEIVQSSRRAADLCRQMLAFSGRGSFVIEPIDLTALVEDLLTLLRSAISKKTLLNLSLERNLPPLLGDASQLGQVIMNLVINASEAIGERSGVVTIHTGAAECSREYLTETYAEQNLAPGLYITLEVADTGVGMDRETQSRIFEPFFTTKFTGRGLGLAAVLGIVRGHKGALKLYSEPHKGTTFKILLPACETAEVSSAQPNGSTNHEWQGRGTVLLVDDEETIRALGSRMLARLGFEVLTASDGHEALSVYREHQNEIVLVLLDLTMPRMDGRETFSELLRIDPSVRVIMSSGYSEQDISSRFAGKGLVGFVPKPYSLDVLRERLQAAL
jgi:DNA-binding response OmpR family regulator